MPYKQNSRDKKSAQLFSGTVLKENQIGHHSTLRIVESAIAVTSEPEASTSVLTRRAL
jgi:hypothetical protein